MISTLTSSAGFFSQFFFTMNHYIYCKKHRINFTLDTTHWLFSYKNGWTDYFKPIDLIFTTENTNQINHGHGTILEDVPFCEYQKVIPEIYQYNDFIQNKINEKMTELKLIPNKYDTIFIRRGDKLLHETKLFDTTIYLEQLLEYNPECKTIFLQTDDYQCYLDIQTYIQQHKLDIQVITLCEPTRFGMIIFNENSLYNTTRFIENEKYIQQLREKSTAHKTIGNLNKTEMLDHMITFLTGIEIILQSNICVTDYSSNVARFIKLYKGDSVKNILREEIDMNYIHCPSYSFFKDKQF